jgi:hypothetical protein
MYVAKCCAVLRWWCLPLSESIWNRQFGESRGRFYLGGQVCVVINQEEVKSDKERAAHVPLLPGQILILQPGPSDSARNCSHP